MQYDAATTTSCTQPTHYAQDHGLQVQHFGCTCSMPLGINNQPHHECGSQGERMTDGTSITYHTPSISHSTTPIIDNQPQYKCGSEKCFTQARDGCSRCSDADYGSCSKKLLAGKFFFIPLCILCKCTEVTLAAITIMHTGAHAP